MDTDMGQGLSEVSDCTSQDQAKIFHGSPHFSTLHQAFPAKLRITYQEVVLTRLQAVDANQAAYPVFHL